MCCDSNNVISVKSEFHYHLLNYRLSIRREAQIPLTQQDHKKISQLLQRPYVKAHLSIQQEVTTDTVLTKW